MSLPCERIVAGRITSASLAFPAVLLLRMARKADIKLLAIARDRHSPKEGMAQTVVNRILDLVRTGMLRAGDRLPSERELIDILDISRPTLREALRALSMLGVIDVSDMELLLEQTELRDSQPGRTGSTGSISPAARKSGNTKPPRP